MQKILEQVEAVVKEDTEAPYGDDMTSCFQIDDQWFTFRYAHMRGLQAELKRDGVASPTNVQIVERAMDHLFDFVRVRFIPGNGIIYIIP